MEWTKVSIFTSNTGIDYVSDMLYDLGITGIEIEDEQDFREFMEENRKYWDYVDEKISENDFKLKYLIIKKEEIEKALSENTKDV